MWRERILEESHQELVSSAGMAYFILVERTTDELELFRRIFGRHFLTSELSELIPSRKTMAVLLANIKLWAFKKKLESRKVTSASASLTASQYVKIFIMRLMVILMNVIFLLLHNEMCQIWKMCKTQRTDIFQITNAWYYKFMSG